MAWDVVMFGSVSVPEAQLEEWLTTPVAAEMLPWLDELGGDDALQDTPEALLTYLSTLPVAPHELFDVQRQGVKVGIACYANEDIYRVSCQALALVAASVAPFGGTAELTVLGYQGIRFGERVQVRGGKSEWTALTRDAQLKVEKTQGFKQLDARIHERFDSLVGREKPTGRTTWGVHPFTGRKVRMAATAP